MHGDSKETFGGNVPSERYYVIAAIARNIQFPGGNDGGALRTATRRIGSAQFQTPQVALFQDAPGAVSRRSVQNVICAPPRPRIASLPRSESQPCHLHAKARVQRELIHSLVRSNLKKFGPDPDVLTQSSRLAAGHKDRGIDRERDNGIKEFRRGVGLPKLGQSKCVTESLR
jgi:hypothetical protein